MWYSRVEASQICDLISGHRLGVDLARGRGNGSNCQSRQQKAKAVVMVGRFGLGGGYTGPGSVYLRDLESAGSRIACRSLVG